MATPRSTSDDYAERMSRVSGKWWKSLLPVQAPYRWNLKRLRLEFVLDVGCGVGRNLKNLKGNGVGVDPNAAAIAICRRAGFEAYTPTEFAEMADDRVFDSLLLAHVLEHVPGPEALDLVVQYLPRVRPGGAVVLICPQERGYASDETHLEFLDLGDLEKIAVAAGLTVERRYSFPFPRWLGKLFIYNESVVVGRKATS